MLPCQPSSIKTKLFTEKTKRRTRNAERGTQNTERETLNAEWSGVRFITLHLSF